MNEEEIKNMEEMIIPKDAIGFVTRKYCKNNGEEKCINHKSAFRDFVFCIEVARKSNGTPLVCHHLCNKRAPLNPESKDTVLVKDVEFWNEMLKVATEYSRDLNKEMWMLYKKYGELGEEVKQDFNKMQEEFNEKLSKGDLVEN